MDKANQIDSPEEIWVVDSETGRQYIMNVNTGKIVREIMDDKLHN